MDDLKSIFARIFWMLKFVLGSRSGSRPGNLTQPASRKFMKSVADRHCFFVHMAIKPAYSKDDISTEHEFIAVSTVLMRRLNITTDIVVLFK